MSILDLLGGKNLIGLDLGVSSVKAVEIQGKKSPRLQCYNRVPLPSGTYREDGTLVNRDAVIQAIRTLFSSSIFSSTKVAVGISGNSVITKKVTMPKMDREELEHQLFWEAEQYLPFDVSEVNLDFAVLGHSEESGSEPMIDVLVVAAKKDYVSNLIKIIDEAGLTVEIVDIQAFALGNIFEFNFGSQLEKEKNLGDVLIDFGAGTTKLSLVEGQNTVFSRDMRYGGVGLSKSIAQAARVDFEQAEKIKIEGKWDANLKECVQQYCSDWVEEIGRTLELVSSQYPDMTFRKFYICGGASKTKGLKELLENEVTSPVVVFNSIANISGSGRPMNAKAVEELRYLGSVAVGLALRIPGDKS